MGQVRGAVQWLAVLDAVEAANGATLDIVDLGGGTGGAAVRLAGEGHRVSVVDPSANALAALHRRALDAGVDVAGLQGDATELPDLIGNDAVDLVLCHGLLDLLDDLDATLAAIAAVLRPGGRISAIVPGLWGTIISRLMAGDVARAAELLERPAGERDPVDDRRRFTPQGLDSVFARAGLGVEFVRGLSMVAWVPEDSGEFDESGLARMVEFDREAGRSGVGSKISPGLHCVARLD